MKNIENEKMNKEKTEGNPWLPSAIAEVAVSERFDAFRNHSQASCCLPTPFSWPSDLRVRKARSSWPGHWMVLARVCHLIPLSAVAEIAGWETVRTLQPWTWQNSEKNHRSSHIEDKTAVHIFLFFGDDTAHNQENSASQCAAKEDRTRTSGSAR